MPLNRIDLSDWVMHFVHARDPTNTPLLIANGGAETPLFPFRDTTDEYEMSRFSDWEIAEAVSPLAPDAAAFSVLNRILEDGHIRAGWAFRGGKPTVYGPRAAVCLTEMPLYALVDYAAWRGTSSVDLYAVGLLRSELHAVGGRPVIYGLSGTHSEQKDAARGGDGPYRFWPRMLSESCGIGPDEQYRYVPMNLQGHPYVDWSHEREWRWVDGSDDHPCPGLSVWLNSERVPFSQVLIVVPTQAEADAILDRLKELSDAGFHDFGHEYSLSALETTRVIAMESVAREMTAADLSKVRLDDIPAKSLQNFAAPAATPAFRDAVKSVLARAHVAARAAVEDFARSAPRDQGGHILDSCGFAYLALMTPRSALGSALKQLDALSAIGGRGYHVSDFGSYAMNLQSITAAETGVAAAQRIMEAAFPDDVFGVSSRLD